VIIFLARQPARATVRSAALAARSAAVAADQRSLVSELSQVHATHLISYRLVNAVAATVSQGEENRLKADPAVRQVIPDAIIHGPVRPVGPARPSRKVVRALPGACLRHGGVQLEPEALQLTHTQSLNQTAVTARSLGMTGAGVTVGWIADGIDTSNVNFIRSNGQSVFVDYKDFSGDGTSAPTSGGEAFLDANSIAGQGLHVYNVQHFSAQSLSAPCRIRIKGIAPGASLVGLKVFGQNNTTTTSGFLDAINYATMVHHVDVLNESFDGTPIPDTSADAIKNFNDTAIAVGVTVVGSTGDAGATNTIGSPATDPNVISVGASTDLRAYGMSNLLGADEFARRGWLNNNISAASSSGYDISGATVDLVAPGDSSFTSCSADIRLYFACTNFRGQASAVQLTGGTSMSSPLTAGVAALVIQAYRSTHQASPTPALVKKIILSTATDLGAPAREQGAGLLNAVKAVQAAESVADGNGSPTRTGSALLASVNQISYVGDPGTNEQTTVTVTNDGAVPQTVDLSGRTFGPPRHVQRRSLRLSNARSRHITDSFGFPNNFGTVHFRVYQHENRLNASIAFPGKVTSGFNGAVSLILVGPRGRLAGSSEPQGLSNFGNVDVINPAPGRWTAIIIALKGGNPLQGTTGKVLFKASTQRFASFGTVTPSVLTLAAGASGSFSFTVTTPPAPGDANGSVVLNSGYGATSIPVTLRSDVLVTPSVSGSFSGVLTDGNGRNASAGQADYYEFSVPPGTPDLSASVALTNDAANPVAGFLVDPNGQIQGYGSNYLATAITTSGIDFAATRHMTVYSAKAMAGNWTLIIEFGQPTAGNEISQKFTGLISLQSSVTVTAAGLPDSPATTLTDPVQIPVQITNNGSAPEDFFLDPRLSTTSQQLLASLSNFGPAPVPLPPQDAPAEWIVPTHASQVIVTSSSTVPITFDMSPFLGDPDVFSGAPSLAATATVVGGTGTVTAGGWVALPALAALDGFTAPPVAGTVNSMTMTATANDFDSSVTSDVGDFWLRSVAASPFSLLRINPGQTATINLTITPSQAGPPGTIVQGTLYVDDLVPAVQFGGSEVLAMPYAYTVG